MKSKRSTRAGVIVGDPRIIKLAADDVIVKETKSKIEFLDKKSKRVLRVLRPPAKPSRLGNARIRNAVREVIHSLGT